MAYDLVDGVGVQFSPEFQNVVQGCIYYDWLVECLLLFLGFSLLFHIRDFGLLLFGPNI